MAIHVVEFRPTCWRGCACPVSALLVPLPCLSVPLVSVPLTMLICLAMCCMRAATPGCLIENSAKLHLPTRWNIQRKVSMSRVVMFFRHFIMYVCQLYMFYCIYPGTNNTLLYFILLICEVFTFLDCYLFHVLNCYKMFLLLNCDTFHVLFCEVFTSY